MSLHRAPQNINPDSPQGEDNIVQINADTSTSQQNSTDLPRLDAAAQALNPSQFKIYYWLTRLLETGSGRVRSSILAKKTGLCADTIARQLSGMAEWIEVDNITSEGRHFVLIGWPQNVGGPENVDAMYVSLDSKDVSQKQNKGSAARQLTDDEKAVLDWIEFDPTLFYQALRKFGMAIDKALECVD